MDARTRKALTQANTALLQAKQTTKYAHQHQKLTPDEYHQKHGKCPPGYLFDTVKKRCIPDENLKKQHQEQSHPTKKPDEKGPKKPGLSERAMGFLKTADRSVRRFFTDKNFRKDKLAGAAKKIRDKVTHYPKDVIHEVKHLGKEFKEAGHCLEHIAGIGDTNPSHEEWEALRTVAFHVGVAVVAHSLESEVGPLAVAAGVATSFARGIAMKAASHGLMKVHLGGEFAEIARGIGETFGAAADDGNDEPDSELVAEIKKDPKHAMEALVKHVGLAVADVLPHVKVDRDDLEKAAEAHEAGQTKVTDDASSSDDK